MSNLIVRSVTRRDYLIKGLRAAGGLAVLATGLPAQAESAPTAWPSGKPIRLIVPAQPGGGLDLVARTTGDRLARAMSVPWIVENMGGGGGVIACVATTRAAPDGQTFMITNISTHGTNPAVRKLPYDPMNGFTHIGMVGGTPNALMVGPAFPDVKTIEELVAQLKKRGGQASFGSAGPGTSSHLLMEQFKASTGIPLTHVPYRGVGPAMVDCLAGRTDLIFPGLTAAMPFVKSARLKALAVTSPDRHPLLPGVPTFAEIGMKEFSSLQWYGVSGPARLPFEIVKLLNTQLNRVLAEPEVVAKFEAEALSVMPMSTAQFSSYISDDIRRWTKLVKDQKIEVELG
jgi:tripartite-type tricarboxylate transporter receptor subunit TctC